MSAQPAPLESIRVGDVRITYIPDGEAYMTAATIFPAGGDALWKAHPELLDGGDRMLFSIGGFLIESGGVRTLVDLGTGRRTIEFPTVDGIFRGGSFLDNLHQAGCAPEDVDIVFYTHMHFDHVGWTSQQGALTFPNARHVVGADELDFWSGVTDPDLAAIGPDPSVVLAPLQGRVELVRDGDVITPGVNVLASPGHTPGHCSAVVSSGAERAIILGDVVHCPLQIGDGDLRIIFDVDQDLAAATRDRIAAELDGDSRAVGADGHFSGSVFGRVVPAAGRTWVDLATASA